MQWVWFNLFVVAMLVFDLCVCHRHSHEIKLKEALFWSAVWIGLALAFDAGLYFWRGKEPALQFLTGYLIEKSLSVDNIFIFLLLFSYFRVPAKYQHEVLFWGILGALIFRAIFILLGVALIEKFHWSIYIFGAILLYTGVKMAFESEKEIHPEKNPVLKLLRSVMPVTEGYREGKFFVRENARLFATPLFVVLLVIETTDIIFAVDSIPAILAISKDPFIVYTSNVFAILGLRALFFALSGILKYFHHLHFGLAFILVFVGFKMTASDFFHVPVAVSLGVIAAALALSIAASLIWPKRPKTEAAPGA